MGQIINNNGKIGEQINLVGKSLKDVLNETLIENENEIRKLIFPNTDFIVSRISDDINVELPMRGSLQDAGYDLYVPEFTQELIDKFLEVNKGYHITKNTNNQIVFGDESKNSALIYDKITKEYKTYNNLMIPTGVQFLFPQGLYGEIVNRSSNSKYNINIITGYIDNSHSNNCCFQIAKLDYSKGISFKVGDRIGQLILKQLIKPQIIPVDTEVFNNNEYVQENRKLRSGNGIGSTGK